MSMISKINPYSEDSRNIAIVNELKKYFKNNERVIDIGCGNGRISFELKKIKNIRPFGVDNYIETNSIPFMKTNGEKLHFRNKEFDASLLIDVLHHSNNIKEILGEASRVSRRVIIKDHFYETGFQKIRLKFIDYLCNAPFNIPTPFNFLTLKEWEQLFESLKLKIIKMNTNFKLGKLDSIKHVFFVVR